MSSQRPDDLAPAAASRLNVPLDQAEGHVSLHRNSVFERRREHLRALSDEALHERFWKLVEQIVAPLIEEARTHTTPSIERSVLLRMGFSGAEAKALVEQISRRGLLGQGAGRLVLELARAKGLPVREAGLALLEGRCWDEFPSPSQGEPPLGGDKGQGGGETPADPHPNLPPERGKEPIPSPSQGEG